MNQITRSGNLPGLPILFFLAQPAGQKYIANTSGNKYWDSILLQTSELH